MKVTKALIEKYKREGKKRGYKQCCIKFFIKDVKEGREPAQLRPVKDGCVLCLECALKNKLISKEDYEIKKGIEGHRKLLEAIGRL